MEEMLKKLLKKELKDKDNKELNEEIDRMAEDFGKFVKDMLKEDKEKENGRKTIKKNLEKLAELEPENILLVTDEACFVCGTGGDILSMFGLLVNKLKEETPEELLRRAFEVGMDYKK